MDDSVFHWLFNNGLSEKKLELMNKLRNGH